MRASVLKAAGLLPTVQDFDDPDGDVVRVRSAGCHRVDLALASGEMGQPDVQQAWRAQANEPHVKIGVAVS
ncbi:hypothetical protein MARA_29100 [Mycolicibacterium arabiense]|uniref:Uncharacterized protein n=1 Tax=Mycolicibacterium arabiense TaxID=1286181 RepID=A0A7I7RXT7_9MYCO|nr:hypothetical protein [Mycolicibacterium arabiense]MCV7374196.1 hypothetical protein [Mycolicibacterium arabiense]BBY49442.1 hypothetical protein MARA_29100 [Mycolicibacterium arabiense]